MRGRHILKVAGGGTFLGLLTGSSLVYLKHNNWELNSSGIVRFGRAAVAVRNCREPISFMRFVMFVSKKMHYTDI